MLSEAFLGRIVVLACALGLCLVTLVVSLALPPHEDAYQYVSAAYFSAAGELSIYEDYFHSQTPYMPALMGLWTRLVDLDLVGFYLELRLFNALWTMAFIAALAALLHRLSASALWTVALMLAVFTSSYLDLPIRVVRNDTMPLALTTLAILVCLPALRGAPSRAGAWRFGVAAALIGAAAMTKQSYAFVGVGFFLFAVFASYDSWSERLWSAALPVALGGALGAAPGILVILINWENASFALLEFHRTAHVGPFISDPAVGLTLQDRLDWTRTALMDLPALLLLGGVFICAFWVWARGADEADHREAGDRRVLWLCTIMGLCVCASFPLAMPLFTQYAAPILPFLAAALAVLSRRVPLRGLIWRGAVPTAAAAVIMAGSVGAIPHNPGNWTKSPFDHIESMLRPIAPGWRGIPYFMRVTEDRTWMNEMLIPLNAQIDAIVPEDARADLEVATLMSAYVLDAGLSIPPEFATMPFFFVTNAEVPAEDLERLHGVAPETLHDWLMAQDIQAVLYSDRYFPEKSAGLETYAKARGFTCFELDMRGAYRVNTARFYINPALTNATANCPEEELQPAG